MLVVAGKELEAEEVLVAGDEALDLVEDGEGVEGAGTRLEIIGGEPNGMAVGLAGLGAAGLAEVSAGGSAEGDEGGDVGAHLVGKTDDHLEVGADARAVGGLVDLLEVAVGVGDRSGFLVQIGGGEDDVGEAGGLGEEHVLDDEEGVFEGGGVDGVAGDGVGADDVESGQGAGGGGVELLEEVEARGGGGGGVLRERRMADGGVAGEHVGEQTHVGGTAGVDVVGEKGELAVREGEAELE